MNLYGKNLTVTKRVSELLLDGYEDPLISLIHEVPSYYGAIFEQMIPFGLDRVGWGYKRNNTSLFSGHTNIGIEGETLGRVMRQNFSDTLAAYTGECSKIQGSVGEVYSRNLQPGGSITIFVPEFCRDYPMDYESEKIVKSVLGYKYIVGARAYANATQNPENACYYSEDGLNDQLPSGVFNLAPCLSEMPVYVSYPHFYDADPSLLRAIDGLSPDKTEHQGYVVVEPVKFDNYTKLYIILFFSSFFRKQDFPWSLQLVNK